MQDMGMEPDPSAADALSSREGDQGLGKGSSSADALSSQSSGFWDPGMEGVEKSSELEPTEVSSFKRGPRVLKIIEIAQRVVTQGPSLTARGNPKMLADHQFQWGCKSNSHLTKALERPTTAVKGKTSREQAEHVMALLVVRPLPCIYSTVEELAKGNLVTWSMIQQAAEIKGEKEAIVCSDLLDHGTMEHDIPGMQG